MASQYPDSDPATEELLPTNPPCDALKPPNAKTRKNQPLRITTTPCTDLDDPGESSPHVRQFGSKGVTKDSLKITASPSPISPSFSQMSNTPSPCIQPTVYFNFEMVESHYTRQETCMEKNNILLKLCAVISCCAFILVIMSAGKNIMD